MKNLFTLLFLIAGINQFSTMQAASAYRADKSTFEQQNEVNSDKNDFQFFKKISKKKSGKAKKKNRLFSKNRKLESFKTKNGKGGLWVLILGMTALGLAISGLFLISFLSGELFLTGMLIGLVAFIGGIVELARGNTNWKVFIGMLVGIAVVVLPIIALISYFNNLED